jgi:hypothetical protein
MPEPYVCDWCLPFPKSAANVLAIAVMTGRLEMISPSSRFWLSEVLEKFSDPMKIFARAVPKSAATTLPWM